MKNFGKIRDSGVADKVPLSPIKLTPRVILKILIRKSATAAIECSRISLQVHLRRQVGETGENAFGISLPAHYCHFILYSLSKPETNVLGFSIFHQIALISLTSAFFSPEGWKFLKKEGNYERISELENLRIRGEANFLNIRGKADKLLFIRLSGEVEQKP